MESWPQCHSAVAGLELSFIFYLPLESGIIVHALQEESVLGIHCILDLDL